MFTFNKIESSTNNRYRIKEERYKVTVSDINITNRTQLIDVDIEKA